MRAADPAKTHASGVSRESSLRQQRRIVEFRFVAKNMGVGVRGDGEVPLAHVLTDPGPRVALEVAERDAAVPQIVRREGGNTRGRTGSSDGGSETVGGDALEDAPLRSAVLARDECNDGVEDDLRHLHPSSVSGLRYRLNTMPESLG